MKKNLFIFTLLFFTAFSYTAQAQVSKTVACTAGNLATLTASYAATVTDLTVTGIVDGRDFKTMRDNMPVLAVIDLSGVFIWAYTGMGANNEIPNNAFYNSTTKQSKISLKSFIFPPSINSIGHEAFRGCSGLTGSLTIPQWVTNIGGAAFQGCSGLTGALTIGSSVKIIDGAAFQDCSGLTGILTIPSTVTKIGGAAFQGCSGLTDSLSIPSSVIHIGNSAFKSCSGLKGSLTIPSSVEYISASVFKGCSGLTGSLNIPSLVTSIADSAFYGCSGFTGSLTIPSSVTTIGVGAFSYCSGLTGSLAIPVALTSIKKSAFKGCSGLTGSLAIPIAVTSIDDYAFKDCSGLTGSLTIGSSVTTIGDRAFSGCSFTGSLTIPSSVTIINSIYAFSCGKLTSIYALKATPIALAYLSNTFAGVDKTKCILHVPVGSLSAYKAANEWRDFVNMVEGIVPTSLEEVLSSAITIYPNPASSVITVSELDSLASAQMVTLSVIDISGTTVLTNSVEPNINSLTINVSTLKSGVYFIVMQTNNGQVVKRFVKG